MRVGRLHATNVQYVMINIFIASRLFTRERYEHRLSGERLAEQMNKGIHFPLNINQRIHDDMENAGKATFMPRTD